MAQRALGTIATLADGPRLVQQIMAHMDEQRAINPSLLIPMDASAVDPRLRLYPATFRWTRRRTGQGRRVFKMAPLHNHFELLGWSETQVMQRFVLIGMVAALIGISLALTLDAQRPIVQTVPIVIQAQAIDR